MAEILTPNCPVCSQPPYMVMGGGSQAFCPNRKCSTLTWNPMKSLDDNLLETNFVDLQMQSDGSDEGSGENEPGTA
jgi:hypothetical protein